MSKILVVDDEEAIRSGLGEILTEEGHDIVTAENAEMALRILQDQLIDLVCTDVRMPGMDGYQLLAQIKRDHPETEVIVITGFATVSSAVDAVKHGAHDYLSKPFELDEVRLTVERALEKKHLQDQARKLERGAKAKESHQTLIGNSPKFQQILSMLDRIAPTPSTVLILGETGTGKELIAREIHERSPRRNEMFIPINCGALPDTLLESELFGHSKGAFTGADKNSQGLFEAADKGTLFLDEIGNISLSMQSRLLRVLETGEFLRLGERKIRKVDVRIVAATNSDLKKGVEDGTFRQDFYYRLNVMTVELPPLRERREDIAPLADHFLERCSKRFGKPVQGFTDEAKNALQQHSWPGNIRELEHALERSTILCLGNVIGVEDLPAEVAQAAPTEGTLAVAPGIPCSLSDLERAHILRVLEDCDGHRGRTAEILGINRRTLYRKLIEYGMESPSGDLERDLPPQSE